MPLITIGAVAIPGWQGNNSGVVLQIYTNSPFTAQSGTLYPETVRGNLKSPSLGTFFQSYPCTVDLTVLSVPSVIIDSTTDSPDCPDATYSAALVDSASGKTIQQLGTEACFSLNPTPTTTTWAAIFAAEAAE